MLAVSELAAGERLTIAGLEVCATPAVHNGPRWPWGHAISPVGYLVRGSRSIYFAGDTDLFPALGEMRGTVDVALLPVWGWGRTLGEGHLDPERAARAAAMIGPAVAVPIHWGTFALRRPGRPPDPGRPPRAFREFVARYAPDVEVRLLSPGERTPL